MAKNQAVQPAANVPEVISNELPAFLRDAPTQARGMENVTASDLVIPRLEVVQSLSPARDESSPGYIDGSKEGDLFNNVTRQNYGREVSIVPVYYTKQFLVWKDRKKAGGGGNGFRGAFNSEADAKAAIAELGEEHLEVVDTAQHFCLLINSDGSADEVVISMAKSKMKVSKRWNSLMRIAGGDSFSRVYKVSSTDETNARNEKYKNLAVAPAGFVTESIYRKAEALYNQIHRGGVVVNHDYEGGVEVETGGTNEF